MSDFVVFVDTNILLDFYRFERESGLEILEQFDGIHDRLVTTYQVEMEFKKNRQKVISLSREQLKSSESRQAVAFLADTKAVEMLKKSSREAAKRVKKLRARLDNVLAKPTTHDPVYKIVQRLFINNSPLNLKRTNPVRRRLKRAAFRRFILGYPPRKEDDTSMGDALNWEWVIQVAADTGKNIAIVTRDSDYGIHMKDRNLMNDWLIQEFRDRVSRTRRCLLFDRLAPALELAGVRVSKKAAAEEREFARKQDYVRGRRGVFVMGKTGRVEMEPERLTFLLERLRESAEGTVVHEEPNDDDES